MEETTMPMIQLEKSVEGAVRLIKSLHRGQEQNQELTFIEAQLEAFSVAKQLWENEARRSLLTGDDKTLVQSLASALN